MPCSGVMMSLKRMAASSSKRRSGCRVTSAASSGRARQRREIHLRAQLAVLGQIAARLAHDPDGRVRHRLAPAGGEEGARGVRRGRGRVQCVSHLRHVRREVADDEVGAGALDAGQRFERRGALIDPAALGRRLDEAELARRPGRPPPARARASRTWRITSRYGPAGFTMTMSAPSSTSSSTSRSASRDVGRIHLIGAPVAEGRRRLGRLAERPVEGGRVLGRVGDDRRRWRSHWRSSRCADREHAAVHHVARRDRIGAGARVGERHLRQRCDRGIVVDAPCWRDVAAVAVVRGAAQAHVRPYEQLRAGLLDGADGLRGRAPSDRARRSPCASLWSGAANSSTAGTPVAATSLRFLRRLIDGELEDAGHALDRACRTARPGTTNSG